MISKALRFTNDVLDQFLRNRFSLDESRVLLNNLIEGDGSIPAANQNKVVISLINIEKDTNKPFNTRNQKLPNGSYTDISPEERFNLYILVSANFDDYSESLKFLNAAITFFQVNTSLSAATSSSLPQGITKLEFEIEKMNYHQMHSLWTAMGAKYQPSVVYKMWLITIQGNQLVGMVPSVSQTSNTVTT